MKLRSTQRQSAIYPLVIAMLLINSLNAATINLSPTAQSASSVFSFPDNLFGNLQSTFNMGQQVKNT